MKANVGGMDRILRMLLGVAFIIVGAMGLLDAPWGYVAIGAGAVFLLTSLIRFCPIYPVLGINTCGK